MATTSTNAPTAAGNIKAALEALLGHPIDASAEQVAQQLIARQPVSAYTLTPGGPNPDDAIGDPYGHVRSESVLPFIPPTCTTTHLLDISGKAFTAATGTATVLVDNLLCPDIAAGADVISYAEPIYVWATPNSPKPCFVTVTYSLIPTPGNPPNTNLQLTMFAWDINGDPARDTYINWRCRASTAFLSQ